MDVNSKRGITLITLVVTIVVLLIIAGVAISIAVDANGIFSRARYAADKWNEGIEKEEDSINDMLEIVKKYSKNVPNSPQLLDGMSPIKFTLPEGETAGSMVETNVLDPDWYNYEDKKWANAKTEDGSMWVWIPRYAYRINESTQTTEVVFLQGITDNYYDEEGNLCQAKCYENEKDRVMDETSGEETVDTTTGFTVHPAFTNESNIDYRNGGWDRELEGIWVAKFEAGYAGGNNEAPEVATSVKYSQATVWSGVIETAGGTGDGWITARNWQDGEYKTANTMAIKFPTFQPLTYSMNYINHNDAYLLCKELSNNSSNIYGFKEATTDTHLMKDSEWGMVSYFSKSQYGLGKTDIYINNISLNSGGTNTTKANGNKYASVYAVTGLTEGKVEGDSEKNGSDNGQKITTKGKEGEVTSVATNNTATATDKIYKWNQLEGEKASTTGNMYGIYDLSGGLWERTPCYVANGRNMLTTYGKSIIDETEKKYVQIYKADTEKDNNSITNDSKDTQLNAASAANYTLNKYIYGTAMGETSESGTGVTSWYNDYSSFPGLQGPFSFRGGRWSNGRGAGLFHFHRDTGNSTFYMRVACSRGCRVEKKLQNR